jgi:peptidoglycan/LPS O-acetylase OafA/YrhL
MTAPHRYAALDAWRGVCACLVTIVHIPVAHAWMGARPFQNMQLFVDFFFVLSGFVICHAYGTRLGTQASVSGFVIRRFGRVWPLHVVVLGCFVVLELAKAVAGIFIALPLDGTPFAAPRSLPQLVSNIALTQAFNFHGMTSWNGPAWSIGVEFYTYLVFAALVAMVGRRSRDSTGAITWGFALLAVAGLAGVVVFSHAWLFTTHDFGFFRCLYGFFTGCLVYQVLASARSSTFFRPMTLGARWESLIRRAVLRFARTAAPPSPVPGEGSGVALLGSAHVIANTASRVIFASGTCAEIGVVAVLAAFLLLTGPDATSLLAPLVFASIVAVFAAQRGAISKALLSRPAQALGLWSYSIYMVHMFIFALFKIALTVLAKLPVGLSAPVVEPVKLWTFGSAGLDGALMAVYLAVVLIVARFTYHRVEAPARDRFARAAYRVERTSRVDIVVPRTVRRTGQAAPF